MPDSTYRGGRLAAGPGINRVIAILVSVIVLLLLIWAVYRLFVARLEDCPSCTWFSKNYQDCWCTPPPRDPPPEARRECDRQLASGQFNIPAQTAHERYLTETILDQSSTPEQMYVLVALRKRQYSGNASDADSVLGSVAVEVHRPNDADPRNNLDAFCSRAMPEGITAAADSGGASEVRWRMFCDVSGLQYEQQERVTGVVKYRVLIKNWSQEPVDYCFVSSCDARYPANESCNTGYGPYGTGSYPSAAASGGGTTGQ